MKKTDILKKTALFLLIGVCAAAFPKKGVNLQEGLLHYWTMDQVDKKGVVKDALGKNAGKSKDVKIAEGKLGKGLELTSKKSVIDIKDVKTKNLSVSLWYKFEGTKSQKGKDNWNTVLCRDGGNYHHLLIAKKSYTIGAYASGFKKSKLNLKKGQWYHLVVIFNKDQYTLYANGKEILSTKLFSNEKAPLSRIGNFGGNSQGALGVIDEVAVWDRPLSQKQVASLYNGGKGKPLTSK